MRGGFRPGVTQSRPEVSTAQQVVAASPQW